MLWPLIAANPTAYPALLDWMGEHGDDDGCEHDCEDARQLWTQHVLDQRHDEGGDQDGGVPVQVLAGVAQHGLDQHRTEDHRREEEQGHEAECGSQQGQLLRAPVVELLETEVDLRLLEDGRRAGGEVGGLPGGRDVGNRGTGLSHR